MLKFLSFFFFIPVCFANDLILHRDQSILFMQKILPVPMALLKVSKIDTLEIYDLAKSFAILNETTNTPVFVAIVAQNLAKILQQYSAFQSPRDASAFDQMARSRKMISNNMVLQVFLWLSATTLTDKQIHTVNLKLQDHDLEIRSIFSNLVVACESHLTNPPYFIGGANLVIFEKIQEVFQQIDGLPSPFRFQLQNFYESQFR